MQQSYWGGGRGSESVLSLRSRAKPWPSPRQGDRTGLPAALRRLCRAAPRHPLHARASRALLSSERSFWCSCTVAAGDTMGLGTPRGRGHRVPADPYASAVTVHRQLPVRRRGRPTDFPRIPGWIISTWTLLPNYFPFLTIRLHFAFVC